MPYLDIVRQTEAQIQIATGPRAQRLQEYLGYIERVPSGRAGRLQPTEGESATAVRRRLSTAAKQAGKALTIHRTGDAIYFWPEAGGQRRPGRPRRA